MLLTSGKFDGHVLGGEGRGLVLPFVPPHTNPCPLHTPCTALMSKVVV